MLRSFCLLSPLALASLVALAGPQQPTGPATAAASPRGETPAKPASASPPASAKTPQEILRQLVEIDRIEPNTPVGQVFELLSQRYDLPIAINVQAFRDTGMDDVRSAEVAYAAVHGMRLADYLQLILAPLHGTYLVHPRYLEITTLAQARPEYWPARRRTLLPLVTIQFDNRPLVQCIKELAELAEISILIDPRVNKEAQQAVSADLRNVPADTAARLLADMVDLKLVMIDNVLYVTTAAHAKALTRDEDERRQRRDEATDLPPPGSPNAG